jgi:protease-4
MARLYDHLKTIFFALIIIQIAPPIIRNIIHQYGAIIEPQTKVACINVKGILYDSTYYRKHLKKYFEDASIKAILLKIESAGSAAGTAEAIAQEISFLKKEYPKPIIALSENLCCSGAYYIASATDWIICAPSTIVGSIGSSIPYQFKINEALEKLNIKYTNITSGAYKGSTDPFTAGTPEQTAMLQSVSDASYATFAHHVATHRKKLVLEEKNTWANGKIFSGTQAQTMLLIDELGSQSVAEKKIRELAIIEGKIQWVQPESKNAILEWIHPSDESQEVSSTLEDSLHTFFSVIEQRYFHYS